MEYESLCRVFEEKGLKKGWGGGGLVRKRPEVYYERAIDDRR